MRPFLFMAIDLNLRSLKLKDKVFTSSTKPICEMCAANPQCKALKSLNRLNKKYEVTTRIEECKDYLLPILFRPPYLGLDFEFNTVRLGKAWADRVYVGQVVALLNKEQEIIGHAEVTSIDSGSFTEKLTLHAPYNHMLLDKDENHAEILHKILVTCYGNLFVKSNKHLSVIYLRKITE